MLALWTKLVLWVDLDRMVEHMNGGIVVTIHGCFPRNMYNLKKTQIESTSKCFERSKIVVCLVGTPDVLKV